LANLQKSISLNSSNPSIWIWLGRDFCNLNQSGNAIAPLQRALALDPESAEANNWLRQALFNLKRYDDAIVLLTNHFSSHSNDAEDQLWLGYSHICKDDYQEAIKHLQRYNLMVPTNYYGNCYLAFALQRLNQDAEAADAYAAALRCVPGDYEANFERGFYLVAVQRFDEGIPNLEKALAAAPGGQPARWLLLYAYLATGQAGKIANLDLEFLAVIPALLALVYAVSLILLMKSSLRVSAKPAPGIGFTLLWFGLMVDGQIVVFSAAAIIFSQGLTFLIGAGMLLLAAPLAVTALLGFARQPWGEPFAWPPRLPSTKIILLGLAGLGAVIGFSFLYDHFIEHLTGRPIADQDIVTLLKAGLQKSPWLTVIGISLAAPITEEILFRGLLFGCLQRWLKPGWVVVITAAAFSLAHMQLVFIPPLFAVGLVLGLARQKTGNLALPIFLHALNNGVASLMLVGRP
jgi:membrane protease YdiL (CAAX protease family)/Tfp pilus assembly protein PilF